MSRPQSRDILSTGSNLDPVDPNVFHLQPDRPTDRQNREAQRKASRPETQTVKMSEAYEREQYVFYSKIGYTERGREGDG